MFTDNPYEVLGVDENANDEQIRKAYLEEVKKAPPERDPERFRKVSEAYSKIGSEKARLNYFLFSRDTYIETPFEALVHEFRRKKERTPPDFEAMKKYLRSR